MTTFAMDLETELYQLEQRMMGVVKHRDRLIEEAERLIDEANRDFDTLAVPLGRQINELRDRLKREAAPADKRVRMPKAPATDGLDDDDVAHLNELLAKRRKR